MILLIVLIVLFLLCLFGFFYGLYGLKEWDKNILHQSYGASLFDGWMSGMLAIISFMSAIALFIFIVITIFHLVNGTMPS